MIEWGISANSHNAALAVFSNDELVFASESERFSGHKNDPHLNSSLIRYASRFGTPDRIYWYEKPYLKTLRQWYAGQSPRHADNNVEIYLARHEVDAPVVYTGHHHSHAAAGYYTSPFRDACVVVVDAIGEFETLTMWKGAGSNLKKVYSQQYPHSVGLWYSAMTQRCGLKPNEEEYILMGMAALGNPTRFTRDILNDFVDLDTWKFKKNLHRGCSWWKPELTSEQDIYDIAAATQHVYEMLFDRIIYSAKKLVPSENLVIMGGCALNCSANPIAYKHFKNVWIMPAPGDSGSSIGSVLAHKKQHIDWPGACLGYDMGYSTSNEKIVDYLLEHKVCAIARGKAEFGPRALGNRSIIADPRGPEIRALINQIKQREQFRPFAPAILAEFAKQYFKTSIESTTYMQFIVPCLESESFPAVVHYDNTSRVQTVTREENPQFRDLLEVWYRRTGCPMLLNTSLNIKGQAMVNDHADARQWSKTYGLPVFN